MRGVTLKCVVGKLEATWKTASQMGLEEGSSGGSKEVTYFHDARSNDSDLSAMKAAILAGKRKMILKLRIQHQPRLTFAALKRQHRLAYNRK